jgi:hypothetical protein
VKPYHIQGLYFVGVCLTIGLLLAVGSGFGSRRVDEHSANQFQPAIRPEIPQSTYAAQSASEDSTISQMQPTPAQTGDGTGLAQLTSAPAHLDSGPSYARDRATQFIQEYFAASSGNPADAMSYASRTYAPTVQFYGQTRSIEQILRVKSQYMSRWPERAYRIEPGTLSVSCDQAGSSCAVSGVVRFDCASPERGAASSGTASFELQLALEQGQIAVTSESGRVISRS